MGSGRYQYTPLDPGRRQFRLLYVDRDLKSTGTIQCGIETSDMDDAPTYAALSYRWRYVEATDATGRCPTPRTETNTHCPSMEERDARLQEPFRLPQSILQRPQKLAHMYLDRPEYASPNQAILHHSDR